MTLDFEIKTCSRKQRDKVFRIYRANFASILDQDLLRKDLDEFEAQIEGGTVFVADIKGQVAGFSAYTFAKNNLGYRIHINRQLRYAQQRDQEPILLRHFQDKKEQFGGEVALEYFENEFTQNQGLRLLDNDMILTHLAVRPTFREQGVGRALIQARLEQARRAGSKSAYVSCWEGGHVSRLYESIGFDSIIRAGPAYTDGSAVRLMGRRITDEETQNK